MVFTLPSLRGMGLGGGRERKSRSHMCIEVLIRVIWLISGQMFQVGLKSGLVSIFFFYIIVNHFFKSDQIKFGYEVA